MCYYSTLAEHTRNAVVGESLEVIEMYRDPATSWLVHPGDHLTAVCLRPGTVVSIRSPKRLFTRPKPEEAIFREEIEGGDGVDWFLFPQSGRLLALHELPPHSRVEILSIPIHAEEEVLDEEVFRAEELMGVRS